MDKKMEKQVRTLIEEMELLAGKLSQDQMMTIP
jgi:hypothetical protein